MENAKKFFEEVAKTEEAKALFAAMEKPVTEEEVVAAYVDVANKLGVELTAEEVKEYIAADKVGGGTELDDEELSQLVGGAKGSTACWYTYKQRENCWLFDACDNKYCDYGGYYCNKFNRDGSYNNAIATGDTSALDGVASTVIDIINSFK